MIQGTVTGDKEVSRRLRALPDGIRSRVVDSIGRLTLRLQRKVMQEKLTGQVLKVRTGTLRRSIDQRLVTDQSAVSGIVSTNVGYGKAHEYGFQGPVTVKEHLRLGKQAFGKDLKYPVWATVKAHTMNQNLPERSFLRSALADMRPEIMAELDRAIAEGVAR